MHYKNGREAKQGDMVLFMDPYSNRPVTGILYGTISQSETCNGRLAVPSANDPLINIKDCLHIDDVLATTIPDSTVLVPTDAPVLTSGEESNS